MSTSNTVITNWSYSGDPTTSPKDEVRFLVGDTNPNDQMLLDGEINYTLKLVYGQTAPIPAQGNYLPAAYCADGLIAKYTRAADKAVGDLKISFSQRVKQFQELACLLRRRATLAGVIITAGGQSLADKAAQNADPDRVQPAITIDGMDYSGTSDNGPFLNSNVATEP